METNLLVAIKNLVKNPITNLVSRYRSVNKMNGMGDSLEFYIKDLLCDSFDEDNLEKKNEIYEKHFSYFGNQNNPPDFIIKNGDAFEVKKIESLKKISAFDKSPLRSRLRIDDKGIMEYCKNCEEKDWKEKDLFYIISNIKNGIIKYLFFIHGACYATKNEIYRRATEEKELTRIIGNSKLKKISKLYKMIDPLKVFKEILPENRIDVPMLYVLMMCNKYNAFPRREIEELSTNKGIFIKDVWIKNPNVQNNLLEAKLIYAVL